MAADASSRNNMSMCFMQAPQEDSQLTAVAPSLVSQGISYMDVQELDQAVQRYFAAGLAPAIHKIYQSS